MNALEQHWPALAELPRADIAALPTPLEPFALSDESLSAVAALRVKRDDLTSPAYGGNKVRKLAFLLGDALGRGARSVITFGAYGSNHALATAVHGARLGLEVHVVLSPQAPTRFAPATVLAHAGVGSHVHVADSSFSALRTAAELRARLAERDGTAPYVIPAGGSSPVGVVGYVDAALEALSQMAGDAPDVVYAAGGTLGTCVGLAIGFAAAGASTIVECPRVTPVEVANVEVAHALATGTVELLRTQAPDFPELRFSDLPLVMRDDQYGEDYAVATPGATDAVARGADAGLGLETTYTGKALSALLTDARAGRLDGRSVVFWDTYSSAPKPEAGDRAVLPETIRQYLDECERLA